MKSEGNKRLLKLISVEALLQLGFENATEQALGTLADVFGFYIETLAKKLHNLQDCKDSDLLCKFLIEDTYYNEQYQMNELTVFLDHQLELKRYLRDTYEIECNDSLLHLLRVLPKDSNLKSVFRSSKNITTEEKKRIEIKEDIEIDEFMSDFIEKSSSEQSRRVVGVYQYDYSTIVEGISDGNVLVGKLNGKPRDRIFNVKDEYLAVQEMFIEDFFGNEKYSLMR